MKNSTLIVFCVIPSELEQSMASMISDRATDEVLEALTRYKKGLCLSDSPHSFIEDPQTPDTKRSRSSQVVVIYGVEYFIRFAQAVKHLLLHRAKKLKKNKQVFIL